MVNNSTNINKTKQSLNSHGQQFNQYQQNNKKFKQPFGQQFNQYQQNNRKFKQPLSTIQRISTKQQKV